MCRRRATSRGRFHGRLLLAATAALTLVGCHSTPKQQKFKEDPLLCPSQCLEDVKPASARTLSKGTGRQTKPSTNAELASELMPSRSESGPRLGEPMAEAPAPSLQLQAPRWSAAGTVRYAAATAPGPLVLDFDQGQALLTSRGASEFRLDRVAEAWEFSCRVAATGRRYFARNANYLAAMQAVLEQIEREKQEKP